MEQADVGIFGKSLAQLPHSKPLPEKAWQRKQSCGSSA
jgi:hypothetical protein